MELRLPDNPTEDDLIVIEKYLKAAKKKVITGKKAYQNKKTLIAGKLIIFQPSQRVKGDNYSMRYYVGDSNTRFYLSLQMMKLQQQKKH